MQQLLLDTLNFDKNIISLLRASRSVGLFLFIIAVAYIVLCLNFFHTTAAPPLLHLLYPTLMLLVDGLYVCFKSSRIISYLPYFTNNNAAGYSPLIDIDSIKGLIVTTFRIIHFTKLINTFVTQPYTFMSLIESPWILILLSNLFTNVK
jgi:hypothetical protein